MSERAIWSSWGRIVTSPSGVMPAAGLTSSGHRQVWRTRVSSWTRSTARASRDRMAIFVTAICPDSVRASRSRAYGLAAARSDVPT